MSMCEIAVRVEALSKWKGPTAVQNGERELEAVDFMGYITESNELFTDMLAVVKRFEQVKKWVYAHKKYPTITKIHLKDLMDIIEGGAA
jgi:hypothetical protein